MPTHRTGSTSRVVLRSICLILLCLGVGCAYFNTFYFARKYYSQAEKIKEDSDTGQVPPGAIQKYDSAIRQCRKILIGHSGSRWVDDAVYLMGASYYGKAIHDSALISFNDLEARFPESELVSDAVYMAGLCHFERHEYGEMEASFARALEIDPEFERKDDILYTSARSSELEGDRNRAVRRYRDLVDTFADTERGEDGLLELGRLYFDEEAYDSALVAYVELVEMTNDQERYQQAQLRAAEVLIRLDESEEAITRLRGQLSADQSTDPTALDYAVQVRIAMARAYNRQGDYDRAIDILMDVTESDRFKRNTHAAEAQYMIGYTYESYMDSLSLAETAYEEAAKMGARSSFPKLARERLVNLKKFIALSETASPNAENSDAEKNAEAVLKIAELYYFTQKKPEEARMEYQRVIDEYPETSMAPKAAYAMAYIEFEDEQTSTESSYDRFRTLVGDYPRSEQARSAIDFLVFADADTSGLRSLLIEPEPDTTAVVIPALAATELSPSGLGDGNIPVSADSFATNISPLIGDGMPDSSAFRFPGSDPAAALALQSKEVRDSIAAMSTLSDSLARFVDEAEVPDSTSSHIGERAPALPADENVPPESVPLRKRIDP